MCSLFCYFYSLENHQNAGHRVSETRPCFWRSQSTTAADTPTTDKYLIQPPRQIIWTSPLRHLISNVQNSLFDGRTDRQIVPHFHWGGQQWPNFKPASRPLTLWLSELNSIKTTTPLPQQFVSTGNWDQVHSNFTVVIYQQLKTAHTVNRNILSNAPEWCWW